ncbi:MAG: UDP-N-acetylmuramoyl-L-alanine--D-glutamate ligase [Clostridia bacterium]
MSINKLNVESLRNKDIAVLGLGISNLPLIDFLSKLDGNITACDYKTEDELNRDTYNSLKEMNIRFSLGKSYLKVLTQKKFDYIFRTPGIRPDKKEILLAKEKGAIISSEIELVFSLARCPIVGITGSDGKTTTTTLISEMLKTDGFNVHLGGNIGKPLVNEVISYKENDIIVLELSSFQLMGMEVSPQYSLITNLSPNHLNYHKSYEEYCEAKYNIFKYQDSTGVLVLNEDNRDSRKIKDMAKGSLLMFSMRKQVEGAFLQDDQLILSINDNQKVICNKQEVKLLGNHNIENILAAATISHQVGASLESIVKVATSFAGVKHRLEFVNEVNEVKYYNDSIASSPTRAIAGLKSFERKVILIAGGSDKYISFDEFGKEIVNNVKHLVLLGQTADKIQKSVEKYIKKDSTLSIQRVENLTQAIYNAKEVAKKGDVVLLSPACASFDMFKNFEQRGDIFKEIVNNISSD